MKKKNILFVLIFFVLLYHFNLLGDFTHIWSSIDGQNNKSVKFGDFDNDGDLDILIVGDKDPSKKPIVVYRNDGNDNFTLYWKSAVEILGRDANWGDYDGDGDLDILVAVHNGTNRIYRNENGTFINVWKDVRWRYTQTAKWGDYDNDGDLDFIIGTWNTNILFRNNGGDSFSIVWKCPEIYSTGAIDWGDYDNDGDLDLLFGTGSGYSNVLYQNNGGTFSLVWYSEEKFDCRNIKFGDYDNDGDLDILITHKDSTNKIYKNNGGGSFTVVWRKLIDQTTVGIWGDYDNDGDLDVFIGSSAASNRIFLNNNGSFTQIWQQEDGESIESLAIGDYDNDGDLDLLFGIYNGFVKLYRNDINVSFAQDSVLEKNDDTSCVALGDYDNDGDLDLCVSGLSNYIYRNNNGVFTFALTLDKGEGTTSLDWGDYDNDGDLDLLIGNSGFGTYTNKIYKNNNGNFTNVWRSPFTNEIDTTVVKWADFDNDGDLDFIIGNKNGGFVKGTNIIYRNNGDDTFSIVWKKEVEADTKDIACGDYDNDGDMDFFVCYEAKKGVLYRNVGNFNFTEVWEISGQFRGVDFGDYDGDGDLDLLLGNNDFSGPDYVYRNDGGNNFTKVWENSSPIGTEKVKWCEVNNDGLMDFLINDGMKVQLYLNNGGNSFEKIWESSSGISPSSLTVGDYNNDGADDIVLGIQMPMDNTNVRFIKNNFLNMNKNGLPNNPPYISKVSNTTPNPSDGVFVFNYTIKDKESDNAKITKVEYSVDGRQWKTASVSGDLDNITTSPTGVVHTFSWNSAEAGDDLISGRNVKLKIYFTSYFGNNSPVKSAGDLLYGSFKYQLSVPLHINGFPQCRITSPSSISTPYNKISGKVKIYGYAYDEDFAYYKLYYGAGENPSSWAQIGSTSSAKVTPYNLLGEWDTSSLASGIYSLRIVAYDMAGKMRDSWSNSSYRIRVEVVNPDAQASVIDYTYPVTNQENVALNSPVIIHFSDKLNPNTVTPDSIKVYDGENYISGLIKYNDFAQSLIFVPDSNLTAYKDYIVLVSSDLQNVYGIPMGKEYSFKFKTTSYFPEKISSVYPASGTPDVGLSIPIKIYYSDGTLSSSEFTNGMESIQIVNTNNITFQFAGYSNTSLMAKYTNATTLIDKMIYIVTLKPSILDKGYYTYYFVTEDTTTPIVDFTHTSPGQNDSFVDVNGKITIGFNKSMNDNTFSSDTICLLNGTSKVNCKITYSEADKEAYLTPIDALHQDTVYTVFVSKEVKDFGGKNLAQDYQWSFRTGIVINRDGGRLSTSDGNFGLTVPPHTLSESASIQIAQLTGADIPSVTDNDLRVINTKVYRIGPENLELKKPVTIKIKYTDNDITGYDESKLVLYFYKNGKWSRIGGTLDKDSKEISGIIREIGIIALMEDKKEYSGEIDKITVECQPRVFSPNEWEKAAISFELPKSVKYSVKVYNIGGRLVKVLADEVVGTAGQNIVYWDGKDLSGNLVANRMYIIAIVIKDGDKIVRKRKTVVVKK